MKNITLVVLLLLILTGAVVAQEKWTGKGSYQVDSNPSTSINGLELTMRPDGSFKLGVDLSGDGFYVEGTFLKINGGAVLTFNKAFDSNEVEGRALLMNDASGKPAHLQGFFNFPKQKTVHIMTFPQEWVTPYLSAGDTPENALDWNGTYQGVLPCADCEGIETNLTLNSDYTFKVVRTYQGKSGKSFTSEGKFEFLKGGPTIKLQGVSGAAYYFVGEGYAKQLDSKGYPITGPLSNRYVLQKK